MTTLEIHQYIAMGSVFLMCCIYTSLVIYNSKNPRPYVKRDKSKKHALLRALLEDKRRREREQNEK